MSDRPEIVLRSGSLALTFFWCADRYQHRVSDGDSTRESVDSKALESPVYTDVHQQGDVLFASGLSGDSHWSASVQPEGVGFQFDVACRVKSEIPGPASLYRGHGLCIEAEDAGEAATIVEQANGGAVWLIRAREQTNNQTPRTLRYRYFLGRAL
ncbi:MAG: hypothetical protein AAF589_03305 [Planctomycetota bacterium]